MSRGYYQRLRGQIKLILGDLREVNTMEQADLIATDPPYFKKYLYLYEALGDFANVFLRSKPAGYLLAILPHHYLQESIGLVEAGGAGALRWWWLINMRMIGQHADARSYGVSVSHKPIGFWVKGKTNGHVGMRKDSFTVATTDKDLHPWQQSIEWAEYCAKYFSKEGDLVADPMMGTATMAIACMELGRKFVGIEIDPETYEVAVERVRAWQ